MTSSTVAVSAWPMWSAPVTFGGGWMTTNGCAPGGASSAGRKASAAIQRS
jgi:hypothetical protein